MLFLVLIRSLVVVVSLLVLAQDQPEVVIIVQVHKRLQNQLLAHLLLLVVVEGRVQHKADTSLTDNVMTELQLYPQ